MEAAEHVAPDQDQEQLPDFLQEMEDELEQFARDAGLTPEGVEVSLTDREQLLDHYLEKLAELERQAAHNEEVADRRRQMIDRWLDEENARLRRQKERLEEKVRRLVPHTVDGFQDVFRVKKKSRNLPHGRVGFQSTRDTVEVVDQDKALEWAEDSCPDAIKVKRSVLKTPIKAMLQEGGVLSTGEPCDPEENGLRFEPGQDTF